METTLNKLYEQAIWVGRAIFERNKTSGSSANMSFRYEDKIYVTASGTCFGSLTEDNFNIVSLTGEVLSKNKPSKELPLHLTMYQTDGIQAVIHTHAFYATVISCFKPDNADDLIPSYTPYLNMKLGKIKWIPYAPPGSKELFALFTKHTDGRKGYILGNHGPIVGDKSILNAFYALEELEESCHIAWELDKSLYQRSKLLKIK